MNKTIQVILGIARSPGNPSVLNEARAKLSAELRQKVFERDDFTCRCCGFRSQKYQETLFLNGRPDDLRLENMATGCIFCDQCFNLEQVTMMRSGVLVWLPEITQVELHHMMRAIFVARISQGPVAEAARQALDVLMKRREEARARLGTDDPFILASVLRDYISIKSYEMRGRKLDGIRLLPLDRRVIKEADLEFNQFPQILAYWRSKDGPFGGALPKAWLALYQKIADQADAA